MEIKSFKSVGKLEFGDSRMKARSKLNSDFSTFLKDSKENETDSFDSIGIHLYYDDYGCLEFVESFYPADISFHGIHLLGRDAFSVIKEMNAIGFDETVSDNGIDFLDAGISIFLDSWVIDGVAAYRK